VDIKGARVLAARIADARRRRELREARAAAEKRRCVECDGEIAEILVALGSVRCHDCRTTQPAA
jgi:hypothetical protein